MSDKVLVNDKVPTGQATQMNDHAQNQALQLLGEKAASKAAADSVHTPKMTVEELGKAMGSDATGKAKIMDGGGAVGKILDGCVIHGDGGEALKQGAKAASKAAGEGSHSELKRKEGSQGDNTVTEIQKQGNGKLNFDPKNLENSISKGAGDMIKNKAMDAKKGS